MTLIFSTFHSIKAKFLSVHCFTYFLVLFFFYFLILSSKCLFLDFVIRDSRNIVAAMLFRLWHNRLSSKYFIFNSNKMLRLYICLSFFYCEYTSQVLTNWSCVVTSLYLQLYHRANPVPYSELAELFPYLSGEDLHED